MGPPSIYQLLQWPADWAERSYNRTGDCAPMPDYLKALARFFASVAAASETQGGYPLGEPSTTGSSRHVCVGRVHGDVEGSKHCSTRTCTGEGDHEDAQLDRDKHSRNNLGPGSSAGDEACRSQEIRGTFEPDAALVNYYWHGVLPCSYSASSTVVELNIVPVAPKIAPN